MEEDAKLTVLQGYATRQLIQHLSKIDLALVDRDLKSQIGPGLVRLFNDSTCIDNLFRVASPKPGLPSWILEDSSWELIQTCLRDSAVVSELDENSILWVGELMEAPFPALLRRSADRMAFHCFREPSTSGLAVLMFKFILYFLAKVSTYWTI
jgi:hypothetical protein